MRVWLPVLVLAQAVGIVAIELGLDCSGSLGPVSTLDAGRGFALAMLWLAALGASRFVAASGVAAAMAFFTIGAVSSAQVRVDPDVVPEWPVGVRRTLDARIRSLRTGPEGVRVELCRLAWPRPGHTTTPVPGCVSLRVEADAPGFWFWSERRAGEVVRTRVVLKPLVGLRNPGGRDRTASLRRRGHWLGRYSLAPWINFWAVG